MNSRLAWAICRSSIIPTIPAFGRQKQDYHSSRIAWSTWQVPGSEDCTARVSQKTEHRPERWIRGKRLAVQPNDLSLIPRIHTGET